MAIHDYRTTEYEKHRATDKNKACLSSSERVGVYHSRVDPRKTDRKNKRSQSSSHYSVREQKSSIEAVEATQTGEDET